MQNPHTTKINIVKKMLLGSTILNKTITLKQLKQLHAQIIHHSLHHQHFFISQLINHCTRLHAPPHYAQFIFNYTPSTPNVFVFTSMLKFHSQLGAHKNVLALFDKMQSLSVKPDAFVYPILIKSAGRNGVLFHSLVVKLGHDFDCYVRNAVMDMYAKHGQVDIARKMFDEMCVRNVADWNSIISGYWKLGNDREACNLFEMMSDRNVVTWTTMVTGYGKLKDLVTARQYFDRMPEKSVVSWNAMLSAYAQNGFTEEAVRLFYEMINMGFHPDETTWVTVISACSSRGDLSLAESLVKMLESKKIRLNCFVKTALLDMYAKCGNLESAREVFDEMGVYRNSVTWNAMISAYARVGDLVSARDLFNEMPERNIVSWNSMIAGYAQNGQSAMAIELFKEMIKKDDLNPDEVTMVSVISACGHLGALELGNWTVKFINEKRIKLSKSGYNSLIYMYSKCGSMNDAERIFNNLETRDVVSYNTLIAGFAAHGHGKMAAELILKMNEEGIEPDPVTFVGVLTACSHAGLLDKGRGVFESIKSPSLNHYACMVDLLGRVGKLDEAKKLIETMPMAPHAGVYGSLLNASLIHRRVKIGEFAADKLFELEPSNSGTYVLLSNIYASAKRWDDVQRIREVMKTKGVMKTIGWSWVEYRGEMHKFIVGDRSHERSEDIYRLLRELGKKMIAAGYVADKECVLRDVEEEEKEHMVGTHSEKLAVAFALLVSEERSVIRVVKNLRICWDCHTAIKIISQLEGREIIVRDNNRFHSFENGQCSCKDYW